MALYDGWDPPRPGWTCPTCGYDYDAMSAAFVPSTLCDRARRYRAPLVEPASEEDLDAVLRRRPSPTVWSALEYACHVRDTLTLCRDRVDRALAEHRTVVPPMGRDEMAVEHGYSTQRPVVVAGELELAAAALADRLATITGPDWERSVVREGEELSVAWLAYNTLHEVDHHLLDIERVLRQVRAEGGPAADLR